MTTSRLDIELRLKQSSDVKKFMRGLQKETSKAEREIRKEFRKTEAQRSSADAKHTRGVRDAVGIVRRAEQQKRREFIRTGRALSGSLVGATKKALRETRQLIKNNKGLIGGSLLVGAASGVRSATRRAQQLSGIPSATENIALAKDFEGRLARLQTTAKLSDAQTQVLQNALLRQSEGSTLLPGDLLSGAETVQRLIGGDAIPAFIENLSTASNFVEGLGGEMGALSALTVQLNRQMGILPGQMDEALGFIAQAGLEGNIELENFAQQFPKVMGLFTELLGRTGPEALREFGAVAQAIGDLFPDQPEEAATAFRALIVNQANPTNRKALDRALGQKTKDLTLPEIAEAIVEKGGLSDAQFKKAFPEVRAKSAIVALIKQFNKKDSENIVKKVLGADPGAGVSLAAEGAQRFRSTEQGRDLIVAGEINRAVIAGFKDVSGAARDLTRALEKFTAKNLLLVQAAGVAFDALQAIGITSIALKALSGSKAASTGAEAAKTAATIGTSTAAGTTAATGGLALTGFLAAIGLTAGGASFGGNTLLENQFEKFAPGSADASRAKKLAFFNGSKKSDDDARHRELIQATEANTRAVRQSKSAPAGDPGTNGP